MNKVVHFEIPADDMDRAKKFYGSIFGWELQDMPMEGGRNYTIVRTVPVDEKTHMPKESGAINGGIFKRQELLKTPSLVIEVSSIDEKMKSVESSGGKIVQPKKPIGDMGFVAYFKDTEGNVIGLWQDSK